MRRRFMASKFNYFAIEALEDGLAVTFTKNTLQYSINKQEWKDLISGTPTDTINKGQKLYFKIKPQGYTAHTIQVMYRKDSSGNSGTDQGYLLIPKEQ